MGKEIRKIDNEHLSVTETTINEQIIQKKALESRRERLLEKVAEIDELLSYFKEKPPDE